MRKLILLRGASGAGKSTFIINNNLERFTLSSDNIRLMFNAPEMNIDYKETIPQFNNEKVWNLLFFLLEERMKKGEFTIIDAIHSSKDDMNTYKHLAEKYRYRLYIIDFTDIPKEIVYERNQLRENYKVVPEYVIDRAYKNFKKESIPKSYKVVKPEDYNSILNLTPKNLDNYKNINIIGDIHGCYTCLEDYFLINPFIDNDFYIFLGDYFDRGIENVDTFNFLNELINKDNTLFLIGNHEDKLYKYACDDEFVMDYGIKNTISEFESNKIDKSMIRGFIKRLSQIAYITFKDKTYIITHGGIPYFPSIPLDYFSTNSFIYGALKYDTNIDELYDNFMKDCENKIYQIHGHRNYFKIESDIYTHSFNLDGNIENGGYLRIANLKEDGNIDFKYIKNNVYNNYNIEESSVFDLINNLRKDKNVFEKDLGNNISSFNFTREAFYKCKWYSNTTKARGLFLDTKKFRIVARSYNKFFNLGENTETTLENLTMNLIYPVNAYLKYNGFLGIISFYNGNLFFASKSTNTGNYVEYFKTIFFNTFNEEQINIIKNKLVSEHLSMIFEVIDPFNDPHIISYDNCKLILLDLIENDLDFCKVNYNDLKNFGESIGIETKKLINTINNKEELIKYIEEIESDDYNLEGDYIEGCVFEDNRGYMFKHKTVYYKTWKHLRNIMENIISTKNYNIKCKTELEKNFVLFLKNKYENKNNNKNNVNIITERNEFLELSKNK